MRGDEYGLTQLVTGNPTGEYVKKGLLAAKELVVVDLTDTMGLSASRRPKVVPVGVQLLLATVKYQPLLQLVPLAGRIETGKPRRIASDLACNIEAKKSLLADVNC